MICKTGFPEFVADKDCVFFGVDTVDGRNPTPVEAGRVYPIMKIYCFFLHPTRWCWSSSINSTRVGNGIASSIS